MSWGEEQQKEIETIRERKITVKLSDADCDRLAKKFGMSPEPTLLHHLLSWGYDPEDYLELLDNIETAEEEKKYLEEHPEEADEEEASYLDDDIADWEEELKSMREDWKPENEPNMDEEIERIKKWVTDRNLFLIINKRRQKIMTK